MTTQRPLRLLRRTALQPGESLPSLFARLAQLNYYGSGAVLERLCQDRLAYPDQITCPQRAATYRELAELVGLAAEELYAASIHRFAAVLQPPGNAPPTIVLPTGQTVPVLAGALAAAHTWPATTVQFCPLCLQEAAYHRGAWQLAAVAVCLRHHCLLVRCCPRCGSSLQAPDLLTASCPACGGALAAATPPAGPADPAGLASQFVLQSWLGLAAPLPDDTAAAWPAQPPAVLYHLWAGLWQALLRRDPTGLGLASGRVRAALDPDQSGADLLPSQALALSAVALQALRGWPQGFYDFLDAYQRRAGRTPQGQVEEDLGYLYRSWIEGLWRAPAFDSVQEAVDHYLGQHFGLAALRRLPRARARPAFAGRWPYVAPTTAALLLQTTPALIQRLVQAGMLVTYQQAEPAAPPDLAAWIRQTELQVLHRQRATPLTVAQAAQLWGIPPDLALQLVEAGLVAAVCRVGAAGVRLWALDYEALVDFERRLQGALVLPVVGPAVRSVTLLEAVQQLAPCGFNAAWILIALLEDNLRGYWPAGEWRLDRLRLYARDVERLVEQLHSRRPSYTPQQLAVGMGVGRPTVLAWTKRGLLVPSSQRARGLRFDREIAQFFVAEYVLVPEAARILEVRPPTVRRWLQDGYLRPISGPAVDGLRHYLLRRADVQQLVLQRRVERM